MKTKRDGGKGRKEKDFLLLPFPFFPSPVLPRFQSFLLRISFGKIIASEDNDEEKKKRNRLGASLVLLLRECHFNPNKLQNFSKALEVMRSTGAL